MTNRISTRHLAISLSSRTILHGLNFKAEAGRVTAIAGPSGSGKSTLLKALSGEVPFEGEILFGERCLRSIRPRELATLRGVLPQKLEMGFPFRVDEVVALGLKSGIDRDPERAGSRVAAALHDVGLPEYGDRLYPELSGGEQQRVQLARVLCQIPDPVTEHGPAWLFLDEPVSSLDIANQIQIMNLARRFADAGGGVIAVMHDLNLTALHADDLALMKAGRLLASGPLGEIMQDHLLEAAFSCALRVNRVPNGGVPFVLPQALGA